jgi:hypothetical protein
MHQYAYGATFAKINNFKFILTSDWEGTFLFENQFHEIEEEDEIRLYLNQSNGEFHTESMIQKTLEKYYTGIQRIHPELVGVEHNSDTSVWFDSVCAYSSKVFQKMTRKHLLNVFRFSDKVKATEMYKFWESKKGTYDIAHLRRDDISNIEYNKSNPQGYSVISKDSYIRAFKKFGFNSNEIQWTSDDYTRKWHTDREQKLRLGWKYPEGSEYRENIIFDWLEDFLRLYFARTIFRANSSFSWWASFLSPTAKVFSPVLDKQIIYGRDNDGIEIDVDFVEGNHPHWMYGLENIIVK